MGKKNICAIIFGPIAMLILILDTKRAVNGVASGIDICIRSVIPSLFPFMVASSISTHFLLGQQITFLRSIGRLCRIPEGTESLLLVGLLGGYPTGAKVVHNAYTSGTISKHDAERMLGFCNNAGPAFIFGILGSCFTNRATVWLLWLVHILSALIVGILLPGKKQGSGQLRTPQPMSILQIVEDCGKAMLPICLWIIIFRMITTFLGDWILFCIPRWCAITINGMLELTNGCLQLGSIDNEALRIIICTIILSFGGICVHIQTSSVTKKLEGKLFFPGKVLQCAISCAITGIILLLDGNYKVISFILTSCLLTGFTLTYLSRLQKNSSNLAANGV